MSSISRRDLRQQVQAAAHDGRAGDRHVDAAARRRLRSEPLELGHARFDRGLEPRADAVQQHAALAVAHAAQRLRELGLPAEEVHARLVELGSR